MADEQKRFELGDLVHHKTYGSRTMCVVGLGTAPGNIPSVNCRWYEDAKGWQMESFLEVELVKNHK